MKFNLVKTGGIVTAITLIATLSVSSNRDSLSQGSASVREQLSVLVQKRDAGQITDRQYRSLKRRMFSGMLH